MLKRRLLKSFVVLTCLCVAGIVILLGLMRFEHTLPVALTDPTGPYPVGRVTYAWVEERRTDSVAPVPAKKQLFAWIWYPSVPGKSAPAPADYLPAPWRKAVEHERGTLISKFLTSDLSLVHAHSADGSDLSSRLSVYPVVIMRAGLSALTTDYSTLAEDLASHGYIVVGVDAPYRSQVVVFPDGRVVTRAPENNPETAGGEAADRIVNNLLAAWTADIGFALDRLEQLNASDGSTKFTGRLDMTRIGVFGHSLGGATAAQFCHNDSRCKAGIDVDGSPYGSVIRDGLHQPFMFLLSDHGSASDADSRKINADIQSIYSSLAPNQRLRVAIRGANHFNFSDGAVLRSQLLMGMLRTLGVLGIDGRRQLAVTAYCVRSFFNLTLNGKGVSGIEIQFALYPEIQVLD